MTICSLIVQVHPEKLSTASDLLTKMEGVHIHIKDDCGKIIVTIEHPEREFCSRQMTEMTTIDGVMSTALVYEHQEDLDPKEKYPTTNKLQDQEQTNKKEGFL